MKKKLIVLFIITLFFITGCFFDPYKSSKYGELAVDAWFSSKTLGSVRKNTEHIDKIVSTDCNFIENSGNKYVFLCNIIYKEKGETVIPLSKNSSIKVYAVFIKEEGNSYDYKVYNSSYRNAVFKEDEYLKY